MRVSCTGDERSDETRNLQTPQVCTMGLMSNQERQVNNRETLKGFSRSPSVSLKALGLGSDAWHSED